MTLKTQSRRASLAESFANIAIGIFIQAGGQAFLFFAMHIKITGAQFGLFTLVMTVLSIVRSYCLRRLWNAEWWKRKPAKLGKSHQRVRWIETRGCMGEDHKATPGIVLQEYLSTCYPTEKPHPHFHILLEDGEEVHFPKRAFITAEDGVLEYRF